MNSDFHSKKFDDATRIKLEVFKQYIRKWLPVFMTDSESGYGRSLERINIYDFFSGPGFDSDGNPGSPVIIQDEVKGYCDANNAIKSQAPVRMVFNDINISHIEQLKRAISDNSCRKKCCAFEYSNRPFSEAVTSYIKEMKHPKEVNLVLMDQFGVKEVTPEVVNQLLAAGTTDILFFISTASIRRFSEIPEFKKAFPVVGNEIKEVEYSVIHRFVCDRFRSALTVKNAMIAPFSIKKGSHIYGVVFATTHELGMEKFLDVCWRIDPVTGEANYNIDNEPTWHGQQSLFAEDNVTTKDTVFETELLAFICKHRPTNLDVYRFGLEKGFHSVKCNAALKVLQSASKIETEALSAVDKVRKGSFYLREKDAKIRFKGV